MTIEEATYFKEYIDKRLNELLGQLTKAEGDTLQGRLFAERYMRDIVGQQMLPQMVFRSFLEEIDFSEAKSLHDELISTKSDLAIKMQKIDANETNISKLQAMLENDYYNDEIIDSKLDSLSDTLSQDIATAQSSATTAQATATAAQSAVDALETTVNKHGVTLQELPFNYPHFIRTSFVLKEGEPCMLVQLPIGLERVLINTLKSYVGNMPEENWWTETPYLNTYILPIYDEGEILNIDKTKNHIQHFQAWQVRCYDIVRSAEITPSASAIISEPCIEIEFGEDMKTLYAEKLGLPCVAMLITEESMANKVWYFRDSKGQIVAKKGFQDEA